MKLVVTQENLSKALSLTSRVAGGSRSSLPVLQNILVSAEKNSLRLAATNLEIAIRLTVGAKVETEGSITIPARLTQDFIASLPSGTISLSLAGTRLSVETENYSSIINGMPADEFPAIPEVSSDQQITLDAGMLKQALQQVIVAASHDETRPVLTGLWLHSNDGKLHIVSTDSYRLAERTLGPATQDVSLLVPVTAMQDVLRMLGESDEEVVVAFDEQQVAFRSGGIELNSRLIDGSYPDYRQLIPKSTSTHATVSRQDLINITKVSSLFARESAGSVTLQLNEADQTISIRSVASQVGENSAQAAAKVVGDIEVSLNSRYLLDALNAIDEPEVTFACDGKTSPCILRPAGKDATEYTHIIMPLRS